MPGDSSLSLQQAIYTRLTGDTALMDAIEGVFDWIPDQTEYPYVSIGDDTGNDWSAADFDGKEITVVIHSWSRAEGRSEVKTIQSLVKGLLHRASLALTGANLVQMLFEFEETLLDPDGVTYHGVQRFRALTQEA
jgi:hypothetical protein